MRSSYSTDPLGFPLVHVPGLNLLAHLLPITKLQFERFLAEPNSYENRWYDEVLATNPRCSPDSFEDEHREQVFLTGILPKEVQHFAEWLGVGFRVPTVTEWRAVYQTLSQLPFDSQSVDRLPLSYAGREIIQRMVKLIEPPSVRDVALMRNGVLEWTLDETGWVGTGSPRPSFHPLIGDPLRETHRPLSFSKRLHYFGFRLVRDMTVTRDS